ncbi:MAG: integrase/recombinase XerD, partial [Frankiaceae bacterium]|nr:integrase/recombinase XerD [Frankiaceae bacterium]
MGAGPGQRPPQPHPPKDRQLSPATRSRGRTPIRRLDRTYSQLAAAGFLARYEGATRRAYDLDLRTWFAWCSRYGVDPLAVTRPMVELYVRWMTETAGYAPATTARRLGTVCGFYRFLVIDGILPFSPAEYVRRPRRPEESPTLGLTHLQFEALLAASRAGGPTAQVLILLLGLLGLRVSEACAVDIGDLGMEHGHRVVLAHGKGG